MSEIEFKEPVKIYRGGYNRKFCQKLLNHMKEGKSFHSFAGSIGVSPSTITRWCEEHDEFKEAKEIGNSLNMGTWEEMAVMQGTGITKGNSSTTTFMMKNLHPDEYKDKQVIENEGNVVFQIETGVPNALEDLPVEAEVVRVEEVHDDSDYL